MPPCLKKKVNVETGPKEIKHQVFKQRCKFPENYSQLRVKKLMNSRYLQMV